MKWFISFIACLLWAKLTTAAEAQDSFDWTDLVQIGDDLKINVGNVQDKIIVTVWFNNIYHYWEQNKKNQRVRATVRDLIKQYHPHTVYTEADVSEYNLQAYTFEELAQDWNINLENLYDGPLVMAMFRKHGKLFWGTNQTQTITLARSLHDHLTEVEAANWKDAQKGKDVELVVKEIGEYNIHDPWKPYGHFDPSKPDPVHVQRLEREGKTPPPPPPPKSRTIGLNEPEKAAMSSGPPVTES